MPTEHAPGNRGITSVVLHSGQPILTAGLEAVVAEREDCTLSGMFAILDLLMEPVGTRRPSVVLLDVTAAVTFSTLSKLRPLVDVVPGVLRVDAVSTESASKALAIGVRGILRQSLPIELQVKCLRIVAVDDLWVEQTLCEELLNARRVRPTRRERQLVSLLAQGLKNKEIAYAMTLSEGTVKVYLTRLLRKVGVNDRFGLGLFALKNRLADAAREAEPAGEEVLLRARASPALLFPQFASVACPAAGCR
jgi:DNA-binding NarL/FixJ family response regulator